MKKESRKKQPFFAKFLENQVDQNKVQGAKKMATMKYPSDNDEGWATMKYPSDNDEV